MSGVNSKDLGDLDACGDARDIAGIGQLLSDSQPLTLYI
ncbi:hypothetical protein C5S53_15660 [Methanophagales archaeon]|nr:hypothetical protein C5S53_15660 [Methanophagales archaeon]